MKEEPEDGPRSMQKVPSLSDLSDPENSLGKFDFALLIILPGQLSTCAFLPSVMIITLMLTIMMKKILMILSIIIQSA